MLGSKSLWAKDWLFVGASMTLTSIRFHELKRLHGEKFKKITHVHLLAHPSSLSATFLFLIYGHVSQGFTFRQNQEKYPGANAT
jgi:hypothetical protein